MEIRRKSMKEKSLPWSRNDFTTWRPDDQTTLSGSKPVAVTGSAKGHIQEKHQIHSPRKKTFSIKMDWFAEKNWESIDRKGRNMVISPTRAIAFPWRMSLSLYSDWVFRSPLVDIQNSTGKKKMKTRREQSFNNLASIPSMSIKRIARLWVSRSGRKWLAI